MKGDEEQEVGERRNHPDGSESDHLSGHTHWYSGGFRLDRAATELARGRWARGNEPVARARPTRQTPLRSVHGGRHDVDAGVRVVDPVDRDLVNAQPGSFGQHQHLGVEKPTVVLDQREQLLGHVGANGLETALGVREVGGQRSPQNLIVGTRDQLPLGSSNHPRPAGQSAADGQVRMSGEQRRDQRAAAQPDRWTDRRPCRPAPTTRSRSRPPSTPGRGPFCVRCRTPTSA